MGTSNEADWDLKLGLIVLTLCVVKRLFLFMLSNLFQKCLLRIVLNEMTWVSSLSKQFTRVLRCIGQVLDSWG